MIFTETRIQDAYALEIERVEDLRGFNARSWCQREFEARGLVTRVVQANIIFNKQKGTLRGLHYQLPPYEEAKLVRCARGSVFAVIVDLRPESPTYLKCAVDKLTADSYRMLYVPRGCALGSQSLKNNTEIVYQVSEFYHPDSGRGIRYDDPAFGIQWPLAVTVISDKDRSWPPFREAVVSNPRRPK
ncbi:MAG: dTDP-4-dehydrorhamnose 3,5-epimerase family protein [Candidatus Rokuibacteriota bacterium]